MAPLYPFARCCLTMLAISAAILALLGTGTPPADASPAGTVVSWGDNTNGANNPPLPFRPTTAGVLAPGFADDLAGILVVSAGGNNTLALKQDATVWSWGYNGEGELGAGTTTDRHRAVQVVGPGGKGFLTGVQAISAGYDHSLALKRDGTVRAWGHNQYGQLGAGTSDRHTPVQVAGPGGRGFLAGIQAISAGSGYSLALKQHGTVWAWGNNLSGQLGDRTTTDRHTPVQVVGPRGTGFLTGVQAISAGYDHSLALKRDGTVWAWGVNDHGQLGDGTAGYNRHTTPVEVVGPGGTGFLTGVRAISAGRIHSLALKQDGTVWAWGYNQDGELGDGTSTDRHAPVQVVGPGGKGFLTGAQTISARFYHSLVLKQDGTLWAWGWNQYGQLGDGNTDRHTPVQVVGPRGTGFLRGVRAISAGYKYSLAVKQDDTVLAWGDNGFGELGDGTTTDRHTPVQVVGPGGTDFLTGVQAISAGYDHSLALKQDGTVWAWGRNYNGELGDGTTTDRQTPVQVVGPGGTGCLTGVRAICAGGTHNMVLKQDGTAWTWGYNYSGQLGDGTTTDRQTPVQVLGPGGMGLLTDVQAISAGYAHCLALKQDGTVWTWGHNEFGQLGDGSNNNRTTPVQVVRSGGAAFLSGVQAISAGYDHSLALKQDGTVWAWGRNYNGELGDGTTTDQATAAQVVGPGGRGFLTGVHTVSAGGSHTLALKHDGTVWAWGVNHDSQLGDGTGTDRHVPVRVVGPGGVGFLTGVQALSAGGDLYNRTLALKQDGTVLAWGYNQDGEVGDGTTTDRHTPVRVVGLDGVGFLGGVQAISAGGDYGGRSLALKKDGTVWTWGYNQNGELGDGTSTDRHTPVRVVGPDGVGFLAGEQAVSAGSITVWRLWRKLPTSTATPTTRPTCIGRTRPPAASLPGS